jgi:hypothetical protein
MVHRLRKQFFPQLVNRWTKVVRVIAKVIDATGSDLPTGDERCQMVSEHIEALVQSGRLEAQGNTKNWRFSEVRQLHSRP